MKKQHQKNKCEVSQKYTVQEKKVFPRELKKKKQNKIRCQIFMKTFIQNKSK